MKPVNAGQESAQCGAPFSVGKGKVFCSETFSINQDLTTNTTTLIVKKNELMHGEWKCNHGTNIRSDSVEINMPGKYWQIKTNNVTRV
jgi:hypothetical protein